MEEAARRQLIDTPAGRARVTLSAAGGWARLLLGHGAGGGIEAPDLIAVLRVAEDLGVEVGLVEQPYRVAGRRSPPAAERLDQAWMALVAALQARDSEPDRPLLVGGRSSGARVACRTARALGAQGVLCLGFPLQPPRRRGDGRLPPDRLGELERAGARVLVVQGERDPFGIPPSGPRRRVVQVPGDHSLRRAVPQVEAAVGSWLSELRQGLAVGRSGRRESNPP